MNNIDTQNKEVMRSLQLIKNKEEFDSMLKHSGAYYNIFHGKHSVYSCNDYSVKCTTLYFKDKTTKQVESYLNSLLESIVDGYIGFRVFQSNRYSSLFDLYLITEKFPKSIVEFKNDKHFIELFKRLCLTVEAFKFKKNRTHNNLNHQNVFVKENGIIVLGNCSIVGGKNEISYYTAPEVLRGYLADERSEVYSLGMILYELSRKEEAGNIFASADRYSVNLDHLQFRDGVPETVIKVVKKALSISPNDRYENALDFWHDLYLKVKERDPKAYAKRKKMNRIVLALIAVVGIVTAFAISRYDPSFGEIKGMIETKSYSLAYSRILTRDQNSKTDQLIKLYIESCLSERDFVRIAQILPEFSQKFFEDPVYFDELFSIFASNNKMKVLDSVIPQIYNKSSQIKDIIDEYSG